MERDMLLVEICGVSFNIGRRTIGEKNKTQHHLIPINLGALKVRSLINLITLVHTVGFGSDIHLWCDSNRPTQPKSLSSIA